MQHFAETWGCIERKTHVPVTCKKRLMTNKMIVDVDSVQIHRHVNEKPS